MIKAKCGFEAVNGYHCVVNGKTCVVCGVIPKPDKRQHYWVGSYLTNKTITQIFKPIIRNIKIP